MRRPGRPVALAAPLLVWGGLHVAGPSVWTLGVLAVAAFAAFWVDHGDDRRLTRPADLWFVPAIFWCAGSTAAGWFGVQGQPWWLLPAILGPVTLWWWVAVALWWPRPAPPDDDPEPEPEPDLPDEPPVRTITVVDRTPLPEPLSAHRPVRVVTLRAVPQLIDITPDRDPDDEDEDGADDGLPARLVQVWPERRKTPTGAVHVADLARLVGMPEGEFAAVLDADGRAERVSARPLTGGPPSAEKGLKWPALQAWVCATSCATPGEGCDLHG